MKTCVIVPAYNEGRTIFQIVGDILKTKLINECVVVDDGSFDNTSTEAKKAGARVIANESNQGSSQATQIGLIYAQRRQFSHVVMMDADGQHDPKDIKTLLASFNNGADIVIASRYIKKTPDCTSFLRRIGTLFISLLIRFIYGQRIFDPTSGFRAINKKTLDYLVRKYPKTFSEPEVIISSLMKGLRIKEVPVKMYPRKYGSSSISLVKGFFLICYITYQIFWLKIKD